MTSSSKQFTEADLYHKSKPYKLSEYDMQLLGYPIEDPSHKGRKAASRLNRLTPRENFASSYECKRCKLRYTVNPTSGIPEMNYGICVYHPGTVWRRDLNDQYSCCKRREGVGGCCTNEYHVNEMEQELENFTGYVTTQPMASGAGGDESCKVFALDCEMCFTTMGLELTQVTLINYKMEVVYDTLVKPLNPILDYNTRYSGIKRGDLDYTRVTLADVQRDLLKLISAETLLVGHGLDSDMSELKIFHHNFLDTTRLYPHRKGFPIKNSLKYLVKEKLFKTIHEGASGHDSGEDARLAYQLAMKYVRDKTSYNDPMRQWYEAMFGQSSNIRYLS